MSVGPILTIRQLAAMGLRPNLCVTAVNPSEDPSARNMEGIAASRSTLEAGAEVNFLTGDSSCAQELNNLEQNGWVEIKGVMDSAAVDSVALPSALLQMPIGPRRVPHVDKLVLLQTGEAGESWR